MVYLIFLLTIPKETQAADATFVPQVSIDSTFQKGEPAPTSIAKYIQAIYNYAIGIVGILAAVVLMFGGVIWLTAGGSPDKVNEAKAWIGASLSGLILVLCSYMILNTINPDLVSFKEIAPSPIAEKQGNYAGVVDEGACCEYYEKDGKISSTKDGKISSIRVRQEICESTYHGTYYPDKIEEVGKGCLTQAEKEEATGARYDKLIDAPCSDYQSFNLCVERHGAGRCGWKRITGDGWKEGTCFTVYKWELVGDCSTNKKNNYEDNFCVTEKPGAGYRCCGQYNWDD